MCHVPDRNAHVLDFVQFYNTRATCGKPTWIMKWITRVDYSWECWGKLEEFRAVFNKAHFQHLLKPKLMENLTSQIWNLNVAVYIPV